MQFKLLLLVLSLVTYHSFGQNPEESDTLYTIAYGQKHGLLQLNPKAITQDNEGFLWVGTEDGLHKFNGSNFKNFKNNTSDSLAIPDDHIRDLLHINDTLWIATNSESIVGLSIQKNQFFKPEITIDDPDLLISYRTFAINKNLLLFSLRNNFILYNPETKAYFKKKLPSTTNKNENFITCFYKKNDSIIYLGTKESGIQEFNINNRKLQPFTKIKLKEKAVLSFIELNQTPIIGTNKGLYIYKNSQLEPITLDIETAVTHLLPFNQHSLFIGTKKGIFFYDLNTPKKAKRLTIIDNEHELYTHAETGNMYADTLGNYWFGLNAHGVQHFNINQKQFDSYEITIPNHPQKDPINPFVFTKDSLQNLWIASGIGIVKKEAQKTGFKLYSKTKDLLGYAITIDKNGSLWAGEFGSGLLKYIPEQDTFKAFKVNADDSNSISDNDVIEIIPINKNTLWVCTWSGGINEFDIEKETFKPVLLNNKPINRARISFRDSNNNIWIGTDEGIFIIDNKNKVKQISNSIQQGSLASDRIFAINEDSQHNMWIGTSSGITKIALNGITTSYHEQKGLPNDFIYGLLIDPDDKIWVSTNYGISILDQKTNAFINYTERHGLQNNEFNGKAAYNDGQGYFYFGGVNGYNIIKLDDYQKNKFTPPVYIEEIELFNTPIHKNELYKDTLYFNHNENLFTINYTALQYLNHDRCTYTYKLEGFDADWRKETKEQSTTYTNLAPGNYTFRVKATDDIGNWSPYEDAITLIITPPFYATWWFKSLFVFIFISTGIIIYVYQTRKLKKDNLKLEYLILQRTQDLKENYVALEISNSELELQKKQVDFLLKELKHRVNNNFQLITSFINIQSKSVKDKHSKEILTIAKNRINIIASIQDFLNNNSSGKINLSLFTKECVSKITKALGSEDYLKFRTILEIEPYETAIKTSPTLYGLLLNEIITNVHKHAFKEHKTSNILTINLCYKDENAIITIADNGIGFNPENTRKSSLGMSLIEEMIEQLDGSYSLDINPGTTYTIWIPFRKS